MEWIKTFSRWKTGDCGPDELISAAERGTPRRFGVSPDSDLAYLARHLAILEARELIRAGTENAQSLNVVTENPETGTIHLPPKNARTLTDILLGTQYREELQGVLTSLATIGIGRDSEEQKAAAFLTLNLMKDIMLGEPRLSTICCTSVCVDSMAGWKDTMRQYSPQLYLIEMTGPVKFMRANSVACSDVIDVLSRKILYKQVDDPEKLVRELVDHVGHMFRGLECTSSIICTQSRRWGGDNYLSKPPSRDGVELAVPLNQAVSGRFVGLV